jgi:glycosyltransferase involved in cell wall biosynthesis
LKPIISIFCPTYNQREVIGRALESFLDQVINVPVEILVHDDCSSDDTTGIVIKYVKNSKKDKIVKLISPKERMYFKDPSYLINRMIDECEGKYIAMCEGDDFWSDNEKLQKQFDFLENHTDYVLCGHETLIMTEETKEIIGNYSPLKNPKVKNFTVTLFNALFGPPFHTSSLFFRKNSIQKIKLSNKYSQYSQDWIMQANILEKGKGFCLKQSMSVWTVSHKGVYNSLDDNKKNRINFNMKVWMILNHPIYLKEQLKSICETIEGISESSSFSMREAIFYKFAKVLKKLINFG